MLDASQLTQNPTSPAIDADLDGVRWPVRLDLRDRRVEERGDIVRCSRAEEPEVVADRLQ